MTDETVNLRSLVQKSADADLLRVNSSCCLRLSFRPPVLFTAHHELPGNTGDLVGKRHRYQLRFLPLQEFDQPSGSISASARSDVLKKSSCANHQYAPQHFVASTSDYPKPDPARGRMVPGCETYPGGKISTRLEHLGIGSLHHQEGGANRTHTRDFGQAHAAFIGAMQRHQLLIDGLGLREQVTIFLAMHSEELAGQIR
jgi:hypothetical protein